MHRHYADNEPLDSPEIVIKRTKKFYHRTGLLGSTVIAPLDRAVY